MQENIHNYAQSTLSLASSFFFLLLFVFSYLLGLSTNDSYFFCYVSNMCEKNKKKKKKISFNHDHMMIMMSMNISHAKRKILFYQTYQISLYALQIVRSSLIIINHHLFRSVVIGIILAKNLSPSLPCVHSDEDQRERGKEDIIPKKTFLCCSCRNSTRTFFVCRLHNDVEEATSNKLVCVCALTSL